MLLGEDLRKFAPLGDDSFGEKSAVQAGSPNFEFPHKSCSGKPAAIIPKPGNTGVGAHR